MSANRDSLLLGADLPTVTVSPWDEQCSDQHLYRISQLIAEWREIAPALGLTETDEENIVGKAPFSVPAQRIAMLRMWKRKNGAASTYRKLADVFSKCDRQNLVDKIGKLCTSSIGEPLVLLHMCTPYELTVFSCTALQLPPVSEVLLIPVRHIGATAPPLVLQLQCQFPSLHIHNLCLYCYINFSSKLPLS